MFMCVCICSFTKYKLAQRGKTNHIFWLVSVSAAKLLLTLCWWNSLHNVSFQLYKLLRNMFNTCYCCCNSLVLKTDLVKISFCVNQWGCRSMQGERDITIISFFWGCSLISPKADNELYHSHKLPLAICSCTKPAFSSLLGHLCSSILCFTSTALSIQLFRFSNVSQ